MNFTPFVLEEIEKANASSDSKYILGRETTSTSSVRPPCVAKIRAPCMMRPFSFLSTTFAEIGVGDTFTPICERFT